MDSDIEKSFKKYQGTGYGVINGFLRDNGFKEELLIRDNIKHHPEINDIMNIDMGVKFNKLDTNHLFFRGIDGGFIPNAVRYSSGVIVNKGFTSCTMNKDVTKAFIDEHKCCVLMFYIPENIKTYIYKYKGNFSEAEILLQRNTQFTIIMEKSEHPCYFAELSIYTPPIYIKHRSDVLSIIDELRKKTIENEEEVDWSD
jgi:hypothetical protein